MIFNAFTMQCISNKKDLKVSHLNNNKKERTFFYSTCHDVTNYTGCFSVTCTPNSQIKSQKYASILNFLPLKFQVDPDFRDLFEK